MLFKQKPNQFLSKTDIERIMEMVRSQESGTSGEIRICIESHCAYMDPIYRAAEIFHNLKMYQTKNRNAVLIYIAYQDQDFALFGDKAIYNVTDPVFWQQLSKKLAASFFRKEYVQGISACVAAIGSHLKTTFPSHGENKNELPDDIIFGK